MTDKPKTDRKPLKVRCEGCKFVFDGPLIPMELHLIAEWMKGARCPSCGEDSQSLFVFSEVKNSG